MKPLKDLKAELLRNPQTQRDYDALGEEFEQARKAITAPEKEGPHQAPSPTNQAKDQTK